jgi:putative ABC transport system permease protein
MVAGRAFEPGLAELVVGSNAARAYAGFELGSQVRFGGGSWTVVGVFDAGGSAFDSELWCDANVLNQVFQRPQNNFQSLTVRLRDAQALREFKDAATSDPRLTVQVDREVEYYEKQSRLLTRLITVLGTLIAVVMGIGAVFAALNTMYSALAQRAREIATMRALGVSRAAVVTSFLIEALLIALAGGLLGCLLVLPLNGLTTGTMNWQTFSHLSFAFRVSPSLLLTGVAFSLLMGVVGGLPPALRAARLPVAAALREL